MSCASLFQVPVGGSRLHKHTLFFSETNANAWNFSHFILVHLSRNVVLKKFCRIFTDPLISRKLLTQFFRLRMQWMYFFHQMTSKIRKWHSIFLLDTGFGWLENDFRVFYLGRHSTKLNTNYRQSINLIIYTILKVLSNFPILPSWSMGWLLGRLHAIVSSVFPGVSRTECEGS